MCHNPALVCDKPLGVPASVEMFYYTPKLFSMIRHESQEWSQMGLPWQNSIWRRKTFTHVLCLWAHPLGKWSLCCTSTGQDNSNEHDSEWIRLMVAEFRRPQDSISPYYAHGHALVARWANDHDLACKQAKTVPMIFIWSGSAQWLLFMASAKFGLITSGGMPMWHPQGFKNAYEGSGHAHQTLMGKWPWHCTSTG